MKYKAVLFDMDGVLISSGKATRKAILKVIEEKTGAIASYDDFAPFVGTGEGEAIMGICEKYNVEYSADMKDMVYETYRTLLFPEIETFEKIPEALALIKEKGVKIIVASSADMIKVETNLKRAEITPELYDGIVCGSDVERRKPFPDVYIKAAELSGFEPCECVAVEDAVSGVRAANSAGVDCVGITSFFDEKTLEDSGCIRVFHGVYEFASALKFNN